jgi:hypothetical protein
MEPSPSFLRIEMLKKNGFKKVMDRRKNVKLMGEKLREK